jgi:signal transduction histidine kinase
MRKNHWNSLHGGVYVPVTQKIQPNPYLEDSLRDLVTVEGLQITKINPAYMTRLLSEINSSNTSLRFHITSLNPIRPENRADEWEKKALQGFENGLGEIIEQVKNDSVHEYRYMAPLFTEKRNKELEQLNATKNKLFTIIAHDLRNPFNGILGFVDLLMNEYENFDDFQRREMITLIEKSSKNTYELLENLLLWSKIQIDKVEINKKQANLKNLITGAVSAYLHVAEKKSISFTLHVPENLTVFADEFTLKIIVANLFSNAVKFTPREGAITIGATRSGGFVEIMVSDTGKGIPPEIIPTLFSIGANNTTLGTENEKGTGLGLTFCSEFVEKNGGKIWVDSEIGKGTTFRFTLPEQEKPVAAKIVKKEK